MQLKTFKIKQLILNLLISLLRGSD